MVKRILVLAAVSALGLCMAIARPGAQSALPAFPGAEGFGAFTRGGLNGSIIKVTTLEGGSVAGKLVSTNPDVYTGASLRWALTRTFPRVIVFEVSGTIDLSGSLIHSDIGQVTIAGQTAPSPGITIKGAGLRFGGNVTLSDILIQHLRLRLGGEAGGNTGGIYCRGGCSNVLIDHVSASWAPGNQIGFFTESSNPKNDLVTVQNSILAEGLDDLEGASGPAARGLLLGAKPNRILRASVLRNLMLHHRSRMPHLQDDIHGIIVNNVLHNGSRCSGSIQPKTTISNSVVLTTAVGNYATPGVNTPSDWRPITISGPLQSCDSGVSDDSRVFVDDNFLPSHYDPEDPWAVVWNGDGAGIRATKRPVWHDTITVMPHAEARNWVLSNAGARPADRDSVDVRLVQEAMKGTGRIVTSTSHDPWPKLAQNIRTLTVPSRPWDLHPNGSGYTNLEVWLQTFAVEVEGRDPLTSLLKPPEPPSNVRIVP